MITRVLTLVAYTALPLVGVLWLGWDWREIVLLYWLENISLGAAMFVTLLRTARATPVATPAETADTTEQSTDPTTLHPAAGIMLAFFFSVHYGMFTLVHGILVYALITGGLGPATEVDRPLNLGGVLLVWAIGGAVQVVAAVIGSLPDKRGTSLMMSAYPRIIVLHLTIILGVFAIIMLQWGPAAAIVLIAFHALITLSTWMLSDRRAKSPLAPQP
ncbi:MAG: hypothetical protein C0444_01755 [Microbacterium sp.]|nr:hypothetical protein [Microbacterium sp.]MBA4346544.1 hypothetical protein [Microbacterium sp.]